MSKNVKWIFVALLTVPFIFYSFVGKNTPTEGIMVNVILFSEELEKYFYEYLAKLEYGEPQTRERFLQKMEYICSLEFDGTTRIN